MSFDLYFAGVRDIKADEAMIARGSCRLYSQLRDRSRGKLWLQQAKEKPGTKVFVDSGATVHGQEVRVLIQMSI